jgi:hypothetical protein
VRQVSDEYLKDPNNALLSDTQNVQSSSQNQNQEISSEQPLTSNDNHAAHLKD